MKTKALIYLTTLLIPILWLLLPLLAEAAPPGTVVEGDYLDVSKQTWIEYDQPITDPLGHPKRPWQPKEDYPFKEPYTGVELAYLAEGENPFINPSKVINQSAISARLNKRGLMVQRLAYTVKESLYDHYRDIYMYDDDKDGKVGTHGIWCRRVLIYETPADVRGTGSLALYHLNSPVARWIMTDNWTYSPGLRRVTRSAGGDRQDEIFGTPITNDDYGDRQIWEQEHLLIGEDVLYEQLLDPQFIAPDRYSNTGDMKKDGEWLKNNMDITRGRPKMNPYRPDGGVECWVVLSKWAKRTEDPPYGSHVYKDPKDYYLKYRISWIEKVTKVRFREEQYDHDNRLIKFTLINPEYYPGDWVNGGFGNTQYMSYDLRRNFTSWGSYDRPEVGPGATVPDDWYTPEHMYKEYFWKKVKMPTYKSGKEFAPCPPLYKAKFPKYRKGSQDWLSKDDMEYIKKMWNNHGYTDEEIDSQNNGDGVIRKDGKIIPVRKHERPAHIHGKPLPVKFPNE